MKIGKLILVTLLVSAYATITVVHINMAQPKPVAEATLDMIEIMTRAFDESEGGEGGVDPGMPIWEKPSRYDCTLSGTVNANGQVWGFGKWFNVGGNANGWFSVTLENSGTDCEQGGNWLCVYLTCLDVFNAYFGGGGEAH